MEKCVFMKASLQYFALVVAREVIHPSPRKAQAIQEVPVPENPTELKSLLGLANYYCRFIPCSVSPSAMVHSIGSLHVRY